MMNRWIGKVAIVTGSSGGIGLAISKALTSHGIKVVGLARRIDKLHEAATEIGKDKFFPIECDVTNEEDILKVFKWIDEKFGHLDVLVNNAGVFSSTPIIDSKTEEYRKLLDTNLIAPAIFAREAVKCMKKCNARGHIINISSVAGLYLESITILLGMYGPSKYGLRALGTELRHEIVAAKLNIKITNISPGAVITDMIRSIRNIIHIPDDYALKDTDIAEAVIYALGTPEKVEIPEITIIPHGAATSDLYTEECQDVVNTNLIAPAIFAREAMNSMRKRDTRGHIINISDIAGLYLEALSIPMGMYGPSKYGLQALAIELRHEISAAKLKIKLTTISPGYVRTDMLKRLYTFMNVSPDVLLKDRDIAEVVIYVLGTPGSVEIAEITVLPHGLASNAILL